MENVSDNFPQQKKARKSPSKLRRKFATNFAKNFANFTLEIAGAYIYLERNARTPVKTSLDSSKRSEAICVGDAGQESAIFLDNLSGQEMYSPKPANGLSKRPYIIMDSPFCLWTVRSAEKLHLGKNFCSRTDDFGGAFRSISSRFRVTTRNRLENDRKTTRNRLAGRVGRQKGVWPAGERVSQQSLAPMQPSLAPMQQTLGPHIHRQKTPFAPSPNHLGQF